MKVLITDTEIPANCCDCRLCGEFAVTDCGTCARCNVDGIIREAYTMQGCPLIVVPPHGDLIDRNKLYDKTAAWEASALHMVKVSMEDYDTKDWRTWSTILTERTAFKYDVADAPVVIPAEEA